MAVMSLTTGSTYLGPAGSQRMTIPWFGDVMLV
jgi:hypothetical protein